MPQLHPNVAKTGFMLLVVIALFLCTLHSAYAAENADKSSNMDMQNKAGGYKVLKSYPLKESVHGVDGELQLLQDSRLTIEAYEEQFGTGFKDFYTDDENMLAIFRDIPPLGTVLRILSRKKDYLVIDESHTYDQIPVAMLEEVQLSGGGKPVYLLVLDESMGMGSYNGPVTYFYEIVDGKLKSVEFVDHKTKKRAPIVLMRSLKTVWKLVPSDDGNSKDILHVACRPDFEVSNNSSSSDAAHFRIYYHRFHFNGREWIRYERVEKGAFWENDAGSFPVVSRFPPAG